jgi:uncharacterized membrane protein YccC
MAVGTGWLIGVVFGVILWAELQRIRWKRRAEEKQKKEAAMMKYFDELKE